MMPNVAMTITPIAARRLNALGDPAEQRRAPDEPGVADRRHGGDRVRGVLSRLAHQSERRRHRGRQREAEHQVAQRDHEHLIRGDGDRAADQRAEARHEDRHPLAHAVQHPAREEPSEQHRGRERDERHGRGGGRRSELIAEVEARPHVHRSLDQERRQDDERGHQERRRPEQGGDREERLRSLGVAHVRDGRRRPDRGDRERDSPRRRAPRGSRCPPRGSRPQQTPR